MGSLLHQAIQFQSCFISFSIKDSDFAERLYSDLQDIGIRSWLAPEGLNTGQEAIQVNDRLLLILSRSSLDSGWIEMEVDAAFEKERAQKRIALFLFGWMMNFFTHERHGPLKCGGRGTSKIFAPGNKAIPTRGRLLGWPGISPRAEPPLQ